MYVYMYKHIIYTIIYMCVCVRARSPDAMYILNWLSDDPSFWVPIGDTNTVVEMMGHGFHGWFFTLDHYELPMEQPK